jgi:phosphopantothenoylcysteine synthetase/decarboxylase
LNSDNVLIIATGSSASIVLSSYLTELRAELDGELTVLMTASAERFVRPEVVGWFADHVLTNDTPGLNPVQLALTASAIVVLPASANTLSSAALGLAATPAQTALLASPAPVLYFPHMNPVMWNKAVIQRRVAELRSQGDTVVTPVETVTYHMWKGAKDVGLSLPDPDEAAEIVRHWTAGGAESALESAEPA